MLQFPKPNALEEKYPFTECAVLRSSFSKTFIWLESFERFHHKSFCPLKGVLYLTSLTFHRPRYLVIFRNIPILYMHSV